MIVGELDDGSEHASDIVGRLDGCRVFRDIIIHLFLRYMGEEVEREIREVTLSDQSHAQQVSIEEQCLLSIFHSKHSLSEGVFISHDRCGMSTNYLDPVSIGIESECDALHAPFVRPLLELHILLKL